MLLDVDLDGDSLTKNSASGKLRVDGVVLLEGLDTDVRGAESGFLAEAESASVDLLAEGISGAGDNSRELLGGVDVRVPVDQVLQKGLLELVKIDDFVVAAGSALPEKRTGGVHSLKNVTRNSLGVNIPFARALVKIDIGADDESDFIECVPRVAVVDDGGGEGAQGGFAVAVRRRVRAGGLLTRTDVRQTLQFATVLK